MGKGLGVCVACLAIFITFIAFGLLSPRNRSKRVILPPIGLLCCIIRYTLEAVSILGLIRGYFAQAVFYSVFTLASFGITSVFYVQNAMFMNNPGVIGRKLIIAAFTALVSVVLFTINAFLACVRKEAFLWDHFKFVEITQLLIHIIVIGIFIFYRKQYRLSIFMLLLVSLLLYLFAWLCNEGLYFLYREHYHKIVAELNPLAIATMIQVCIQFFVFYTVTYGKLFENKIKLGNALVSASQSQIQPHFINNVLYNIKVLYSTDAERAEKMLDNLSMFLKGNKDAFDTVSFHPFERELEHINCYLEIEKERFDNISVVYDIQVKDFMIPPLTLQPIVENCIQHGLRPKKTGGILFISTKRENGSVIISVKDDGVGFDVNKPMDGNRKHLGIENTKFRIEKICGGTLIVNSIVNAGSEFLITIPQND